MNKPSIRLLTAAILSLFTAACGDTTRGVGELGRVEYKIFTHYVVDEGALRDVEIVTGHPQIFNTSLTDKGKRKADSTGELTHRVRPADGADLSQDKGARDFVLTVTEPGTYTIETMRSGDVFDYIELAFDEPTKLSLVTWTLGPDDEEWTKEGGSGKVKVEVGTQATFLPIPKDSDGNRLVGDVEATLEATPEDAVVSGENVFEVYEQRVLSLSSPVTIFFLDAADVKVKLSDESNGVSGSRTFDVQD